MNKYFALAFVMIISGPAFAQKRVTTKKTSTVTTKRKTVGDLLGQVRQESRGAGVKVGTAKANAAIAAGNLSFQQRNPVDLNAVKPPRSKTFLKNESGGETAEYERILDQQIKELYKLTQRFKNSNNRGELWLRLAELYVEKSTLIDNRKQDEYDAKLKAFETGKSKEKPVYNMEEAKDYNRKSIQLYEWFERDFPKDQRIAQALFFLGFNHFELGNTAKGAEYYDRLTKQYPSSPFVLEAHFALAEYYFENEKWTDAYKEYAPLIKAKNHRLNSFALYKGAWCLYRLGKFSQALKYLEYIIKSSGATGTQSAGGKKVVNRGRLENEALRDIIVFYAAQGDPNKAADYFRSITGKANVSDHLEKLAYYYSDKGNRDAAHDVFTMLIAQDPTNPKAFEFQYQIVQNYFYSKNSPQFKENLYKWVKDYGTSGAWHKANEGNKELIANSFKLRETTLRNWTLQQHQTAQNSRAAFSQGQALEGYHLYMQEFSTAATAADMHFYYGELLYDLKKYDEASDNYKWVVDNAPKSPFHAKAAQNLLHAAEKGIPDDAELAKRVGNRTDPLPLEPAVEKFIAAGAWYIEKFPNGDKRAEIQFRIGRLYYQHNRFDEAEKVFKEITQKYPKTKFADYSANLLLDIYNLRKDYIGLEKTGAELLAIPGFAESKTGQEVKGVLEKASFRKAQELEGQKNYAEAAKQFEIFSVQNNKSDLATTAMFNAGVNYERAGNNGAAIAVYNKLLNTPGPQAESQKPKIRRFLAKLYQDAGLFDQSAEMYKKAAEENPKDPLATNFIFNSAVMFEATGKDKKAIMAYNEFIKKNRKHSENMDALYSMAQLYRKNEQNTMALNTFKEFLEGNPPRSAKTVEANYRISEIMQRRNVKEADEWREKTLVAHRRVSADAKSETAQFPAKIKLREARATLAEYQAVRIPNDPNKQKRAVDTKIQLLSKLNKNLNDVIKYDSAEEIVAALTLLGDSNQHMVDAIQRTAMPSGLTPEQKVQYTEGLKKITDPFQNKAREAYQLALARANELDIYNEDYEKARSYLSRFDPSIHRGDELSFEGNFIDWMRK
ncbi:MAG: tetratricopeptide repeat protein [Bdellovibrionota bacterium]